MAERHPEAVALSSDEQQWTFLELQQRVNFAVAEMDKAGLEVGDIVMACGRNSVELVVLILACLRSGRIVLPVNPAFPDDKLSEIVERIGIKAIWCAEEQRLPHYLQLGREIVSGQCSQLSKQSPVWDDERICNLVLTSGSSGVPKAAAHCFRNHRASAEGSAHNIPLNIGDGWLLSLPLFHIGGLATLFRCLLSGATVVLPDNRSDLASALYGHSVTHLSLVNTQLYRLLNTPEFHFHKTSVRTVLMGGGYVAADLVAACQQQGVRVLTSYGMTEMSSQICTGEPVFTEDGGVSSGQCLPGAEVLLDDDGHVMVRGRMLFKGYWQGGCPVLPLNADGWFFTGDKGRWLEELPPMLQIVGRADFQFISGGENIQPETIEKVILSLPDIQQAVVVPVDNEEYGQRPLAFVDSRGDFLPELWQHTLRGKLPGFMIPDYFLAWPDPQNDAQNQEALSKAGIKAGESLKVDRRAFSRLATRLISGHT
ncbi:o-succinylbenzoate--CoA ligase [Parendozoicomonas haliclonae]|nr:o-succinylbenzoate--CoA ligase [Parendozoicomonas haliclonae]